MKTIFNILILFLALSTNAFASPIIDLNGTEAWSHLPDDIQAESSKIMDTPKYIIVNIAEQKLWYYDNGQMILESKVIVGKTNKRTPRMTTTAVSIVYNPTWYPTPSIIAEGAHITPPGPHNPLGHFKLQLTNKYNVYIHSTNHPELFEKKLRLFSHGCIRTEKMKELARLLSSLEEEDFEKRARSWKTSTEKIQTITVYVVNWPYVYSEDQFVKIKNPYS